MAADSPGYLTLFRPASFRRAGGRAPKASGHRIALPGHTLVR